MRLKFYHITVVCDVFVVEFSLLSYEFMTAFGAFFAVEFYI